MSFRDPIIDELYEVRAKLLHDCNDDLHELVLRQQQLPIPPGMRAVSSDEVKRRQREIEAAHEASIAAGG